jgi:hypothetical protein
MINIWFQNGQGGGRGGRVANVGGLFGFDLPRDIVFALGARKKSDLLARGYDLDGNGRIVVTTIFDRLVVGGLLHFGFPQLPKKLLGDWGRNRDSFGVLLADIVSAVTAHGKVAIAR